MPIAGTIVAESLRPGSELTLGVDLARMARQPIASPGEGQPKVWTLIDFRCANRNQADALAQQLSEALADGPWYTDYGDSERKWIVFSGKIFTFARSDDEAWDAAVAHGRSVGVPESQLDWAR